MVSRSLSAAPMPVTNPGHGAYRVACERTERRWSKPPGGRPWKRLGSIILVHLTRSPALRSATARAYTPRSWLAWMISFNPRSTRKARASRGSRSTRRPSHCTRDCPRGSQAAVWPETRTSRSQITRALRTASSEVAAVVAAVRLRRPRPRAASKKQASGVRK